MTAPGRARRLLLWAAPVLVAALLAAVVVALNVGGEDAVDDTAPPPPAPGQVARGEYLARAGNCGGCHSAPGGAAYAGGRAVDTPFGAVYAPNITPDAETGIGRWSRSAFWRALHHGRSRDGRLLYPAFPYPSYTHVSRDDADALHAYLRSVPPVRRANTPHALRFPYGTQAALALWRALFFRPGGLQPVAQQDADWNRGRYLVLALGHCAACHSGRNALGATGINAEFAGGLMPDEGWYAPSLASRSEAGVQGWPRGDVVRLLRDGISPQASVTGPMAEVVWSSTRHLRDADLDAMARFLASIPLREHAPAAAAPATPEMLARGAAVYARHCAACHGDDGRGVTAVYPALAGNRAVTLAPANNVVQVIRHGGFAPATAGNPRPYGMPPFGHVLDEEEIAAVASYIRQSWGNGGGGVARLDVLRVR